MARIARVVIPGYPHHIVQRGNRSQKVFFSDEDKKAYLEILSESAKRNELKIWAYCLMDNHIHLIVVPASADGLAKGIGETHRRYTRLVNFREGWRGYLWQGRFSSFCLDEKHLYAAIRYVETNPVRAGIVTTASEYSWSSAKAHIDKENPSFLDDCFLAEVVNDWGSFLSQIDERQAHSFRRHISTGRPFGNQSFLNAVEKKTGRQLGKRKPGPKPKQQN
jgi:putative transposase